jgi:hypothetical protein
MAEQRQRHARWQHTLQELRDNTSVLIVLHLPVLDLCEEGSADYIYQPSGQFVGSALQRSLERNTVLQSISLAWPQVPDPCSCPMSAGA